MESLPQIICAHAYLAPYIIFGLILLAGVNVPISEDIILLASGLIANTCMPEHAYYLYVWVFLGCWISAWEAYWFGRLLGPKAYTVPWLNHFINEGRIARMHHYYEKYGVFTFIIGRFIPGGVRNALFMTSGMGKMPFLTFIMRDFCACLIATATIFTIGYQFGEYYTQIARFIDQYEKLVIGIVIVVITTALLLFWRSKHHQGKM